jgi:hypothetical protein
VSAPQPRDCGFEPYSRYAAITGTALLSQKVVFRVSSSTLGVINYSIWFHFVEIDEIVLHEKIYIERIVVVFMCDCEKQ